MKFTTLSGNERTVPHLKKYLINWKGKSRSKYQRSVKKFLSDFWSHHVVFEEFPLAGSKMTFDFYNANKKIAIEVQGAQHTKYVPFFHQTRSDFASQIKRDEKKLEFCRINKIKLIEIYPEDQVDKLFFEAQGVYL